MAKTVINKAALLKIEEQTRLKEVCYEIEKEEPFEVDYPFYSVYGANGVGYYHFNSGAFPGPAPLPSALRLYPNTIDKNTVADWAEVGSEDMPLRIFYYNGGWADIYDVEEETGEYALHVDHYSADGSKTTGMLDRRSANFHHEIGLMVSGITLREYNGQLCYTPSGSAWCWKAYTSGENAVYGATSSLLSVSSLMLDVNETNKSITAYSSNVKYLIQGSGEWRT